jgi:hypothetical protein
MSVDIWQARRLLEARYGTPEQLRDRIQIVFARNVNEHGLVWWSSEAVRAAIFAAWPERGLPGASFLRGTLARLPDWQTLGYRRQRSGGPGRGVAVRALCEPLRFQIGLQETLEEARVWASRRDILTARTGHPEKSRKASVHQAVRYGGPDKEHELHTNPQRGNSGKQESPRARERERERIRRLSEELDEQFLLAVALDDARDERLGR